MRLFLQEKSYICIEIYSLAVRSIYKVRKRQYDKDVFLFATWQHTPQSADIRIVVGVDLRCAVSAGGRGSDFLGDTARIVAIVVLARVACARCAAHDGA